jgi:DMSO/TMAO reductase YedYZ molybdopterin-dependent catalytic subunit
VWADRLRTSSLATLFALIPHYTLALLFQQPLLIDVIAEWIMARTPNYYALAIMNSLGSWAKPAAATGGLAALGFALLLGRWLGWWLLPVLAALYSFVFDVWAWSFWIPATAALWWLQRKPAPAFDSSRRTALAQIASPVIMAAGTAAVAIESRVREQRLSGSAITPVDLPPAPTVLRREDFAPGLVRPIITPTAEFYGMSKNTVDPAIDPRQWRLRVFMGDDRTPAREYSYSQLLSMQRQERYITLRCVSNTLKSNLMGCAHWGGVPLRSLVDPSLIGTSSRFKEVAILGTDGHGDSLSLDYAFSDGAMFALGMNGRTLDRTHGFPIRLLAPRYYGFKSVKWISEIRFVTEPYFGTWPRMGYTKEPLVHIACYIDKVRRAGDFVEAGGISCAGDRGIQQVRVRIDTQEWVNAVIESPLSDLTWVRWKARVPYLGSGAVIEAQAQDGAGHWQETEEGPLAPDGVKGPTIRRLAL